mgnify:CR=1 FL=1
MVMAKIRFKDYRLQFIAQLRKDIIHKPLESISVIVSVLMVFISMFMTLFTTWLVLWQNSKIAKATNDLSQNISAEQLNQAKIISDADDIIKKRLNEIELKQAEYMKQQAEHILKMTVSMDEYTNVMKSLVGESKKQADIANEMFALSKANVEIHAAGVYFPKKRLIEISHNGANDGESTVIMIALRLTNKSSNAVDILGMECKLTDETLTRQLCMPIALLDSENEVIIFQTPEDFKEKVNESSNAAPFKQEMLGKYYGKFAEYPMSFTLQPFEEKIGYVFFHSEKSYKNGEIPAKLGIKTNRDIFYQEIFLDTSNDMYSKLPLNTKQLIQDELDKKQHIVGSDYLYNYLPKSYFEDE